MERSVGGGGSMVPTAAAHLSTTKARSLLDTSARLTGDVNVLRGTLGYSTSSKRARPRLQRRNCPVTEEILATVFGNAGNATRLLGTVDATPSERCISRHQHRSRPPCSPVW